jgi:hypothetical protein
LKAHSRSGSMIASIDDNEEPNKKKFKEQIEIQNL